MWLFLALLALGAAFVWPTQTRRAKRQLAAAGRAAAAQDWAGFDKQIAAALASAEGIGNKSVREETLGEINLTRAWGAHRRGDLDTASTSASKAIEHIEHAQAPNREARLVNARHLWGDVECDRGDLDAASEQFRAAAKTVEFGRNPELALFSLQRLGDALLEQERYEEAREVIERCAGFESRVIAGVVEKGGINGEVISMCDPDLALANRDYSRAEELFQEKVDHWSAAPARPAEINLTRYQFHLASAQQALGRHAAAAYTLSQAVEMAELDFGPDHPRAARARQKLAAALKQQQPALPAPRA